MKSVVYISDVRYLGERCRLLIILGRLSLAVSRERWRFNLDLTLNGYGG